jgi:hypothetical protein
MRDYNVLCLLSCCLSLLQASGADATNCGICGLRNHCTVQGATCRFMTSPQRAALAVLLFVTPSGHWRNCHVMPREAGAAPAPHCAPATCCLMTSPQRAALAVLLFTVSARKRRRCHRPCAAGPAQAGERPLVLLRHLRRVQALLVLARYLSCHDKLITCCACCRVLHHSCRPGAVAMNRGQQCHVQPGACCVMTNSDRLILPCCPAVDCSCRPRVPLPWAP